MEGANTHMTYAVLRKKILQKTELICWTYIYILCFNEQLNDRLRELKKSIEIDLCLPWEIWQNVDNKCRNIEDQLKNF